MPQAQRRQRQPPPLAARAIYTLNTRLAFVCPWRVACGVACGVAWWRGVWRGVVLRGEVRVATQPCGAVLLWWRNTQSMEAAQRTGSLSLKCGTRNTQPRTTWWRSTPMAVAVYVSCNDRPIGSL